jgi:hypothetical protein
MDIPLVNTAPASAPRSVAPVVAPAVAPAAQAQTVAALLAQTTVDLSPMGRFLSAIALFQKRLIEQQANASEAAAEEASAALVAAVIAVADSANTLQTSAITASDDGQTLGTLFQQQFDAQTGTAGDSASLAEIGLTVDENGLFNVDTEVLEAALNEDPTGATTLLTRAGAAFGALGGVTPEAGADPTVLTDGQPSLFDLPVPAAPAEFEELPVFADAAPAPTSDDNFLQELLATTPRPALALDQAPPPAISEAAATFAAQPQPQPEPQLLQAPAPAPAQTQSQPQAQPDASAPQPAAASAPASVPVAAPDVPAQTIGRSPPDQPAVETTTAPAAQLPPERVQETRDAERDANVRFADTVAAERAANQRILNAEQNARLTQAELREEQVLEDEALARSNAEASEQQRLARNSEQMRLDRLRENRELDAADLEEQAPLRERLASTVLQYVAPAGETVATNLPQQQQPQPFNNTQQLARDPSIAAAIAAYNLNTGPFAALNGRPELAPTRPRPVAPVENVTRVAAIETDAATGESTRPFR